ncbi:hypothetical protein S245_042599 [Arachis hypogaea]
MLSFCSSSSLVSSSTLSPSHFDHFFSFSSAALRFSPIHTESVFKSIFSVSPTSRGNDEPFEKAFFLSGPIQSREMRTRFFRYRDGDEEPLIDYDDIQSNLESHHDDAPLDDYEDEGDGGDRRHRKCSQTPVYDNDSSKSMSKKRLIKNGDTGRQSMASKFEDEGAKEEYKDRARFTRKGRRKG